MAGLALLDGTDATIDITLNGQSYKGIMGAWVARMGRDFFEQTTFASGGWRQRVPGMKQVTGSMAGFNSKGVPASDPLALFANQTPYAGVFTSNTTLTPTACTLSGNFHEASDSISEIAAGVSGRAIDFESSGAVTSVWVVS